MAKDTRDLILKTSLRLFSEQGYHGTTMRQIAQRAGLSLGLAYRYFESKESILEGIIESHDTILKKYLPEKLNPSENRSELIHFLGGQIVKLVKENEEYLRLYWSLMLQPKIHRLKKRNIHLVNLIFYENSKKIILALKPNYTEFEVKNLTSAIIGYMINHLSNKREFTLEDFKAYIVYALENT